MRALAYLEVRYARHVAAAILRSPLRLAIWIPYAAATAYFAYSRTAGRPAGSASAFELSAPHATALAGLYLGMLCLGIAVAAGGKVTAFRSDAEAVLFANAGIAPRTIVVWLQIRKLANGWLRTLGGLFYFFLVFAPRQTSGAILARAFIATLLAAAIQMSVELPAFLLARGRFNTLVRGAAWTLAAAGFVLAALGFFAAPALARVLQVAPLDPGTIVDAVVAGKWSAIAALSAVLGVSIGSIALLGSDAIPEIYAASRHARGGGRPERFVPAGQIAVAENQSAARIPPGAFALLWKDWVAFKRNRGALPLWVATCAFSTLCGAGVALAAKTWDDPSPVFVPAALIALLLLAFAPAGAALGLASDLANPLFWLSSASLRTRIGVWTFARAWRGGLGLGLAPFAAGVAGGNAALSLAALPLTLATYWSLQALGVGLYALFPSPVDARGPVVLLRTLGTLAFSLAPLAVAAGALALGGAPIVAALCAALAFVLEGGAAVQFASLRFSERGAAFGTEARTV